jgi:hypothetical protein
MTKFLRSVGLMRSLSAGSAQSVLIGIVMTMFAFALHNGPPLFQIIGMVWIGAVALNLFAAIVLAFTATDVSAAE